MQFISLRCSLWCACISHRGAVEYKWNCQQVVSFSILKTKQKTKHLSQLFWHFKSCRKRDDECHGKRHHYSQLFFLERIKKLLLTLNQNLICRNLINFTFFSRIYIIGQSTCAGVIFLQIFDQSKVLKTFENPMLMVIRNMPFWGVSQKWLFWR